MLVHATISMTLDIYSHVVSGVKEEATKLFDEALSIYQEKKYLLATENI
jgi:hypothetical protein